MRVRLKGIAKVQAKLATGEMVFYFYAWRGGPRLKGQPGTPEFIRSYNEAVEKRKTPPQGLLFTLISEFKSSAEFTGKSVPTQRAYRYYLKLIENEFGDLPIAALDDPEVRGEFMRWRDGMASKPRTADYAWATLRRVLSVAKNRGRIRTNPCEDGGKLYKAERTDKVWGEAEIARVMTVAPKYMELALLMALWTGQRQGDLLRLTWSAYDGKAVRLRQSKTGRSVVVPVSAYLKPVLDSTEHASTQILTTAKGHAWTSNGFRASWRKLCERAGVKELTFHDLRGSAVVRMALSGATVPEIATLTGHGLKDVEAILDAHYLGRDVRLAESAIRKLDRNERRARKAK